MKSLYHAAALHDIGKMGMPERILLKRGSLTDREFKIMRNHTMVGEIILKNILALYPQNRGISMGIEIARSHHEHWNGTGYPDGLLGSAIPISARIMALADVYDVLRSKRPYKRPFTHKRSLEIILEESGIHFDPEIVEIFLGKESKFLQISIDLQDPEDE